MFLQSLAWENLRSLKKSELIITLFKTLQRTSKVSFSHVSPEHSIDYEMDANNADHGNHCPQKGSTWTVPVQHGVDVVLAVLSPPASSNVNYIEEQIAVQGEKNIVLMYLQHYKTIITLLQRIQEYRCGTISTVWSQKLIKHIYQGQPREKCIEV